MSHKAYLSWHDGEVEIDLDCIQQLFPCEEGLEVIMFDANASFFIRGTPAETKSIFTQLHNAIHGPNAETAAALKLLNG